MFTSYIILTNCTARKRCAGPSLKLTAEFVGKSLGDTAWTWSNALTQHKPSVPAQQLYAGRSIVEAKRVAEHLEAPMYVASAGFGLIHASTPIAPYDVTASGSGTGLQAVIEHHDAKLPQWWDALCRSGGVSDLLGSHRKALLLAALPASYLEMLSEDLMRCPPASLARIRLFTSRAGAINLPRALVPTVMPYDERLESIQGYAGTRVDFPQRALKHFVEKISGHRMDQSEGVVAVRQALERHQAPSSVARKRADDEQIKEMIHQQWNAVQGRGSMLLRHLRDVALVSCEQGRFARLCREVREERSVEKA